MLKPLPFNRRLPKGYIAVPTNYFYGALGLILVLLLYILFRQMSLHSLVQDGRFYRDQLRGFQLVEEWTMTKDQLKRDQKALGKKIVESGPNQITRERLGRHSWGLLHTITGTFPDEISVELEQQFNTFLILFAKMYPCKLCAHHFLNVLDKEGPFTGTTKEQLMKYLCNLHNKVNRRLKKPKFDCEDVVNTWSSCGCQPVEIGFW